jgi:hypothetical protein
MEDRVILTVVMDETIVGRSWFLCMENVEIMGVFGNTNKLAYSLLY